MVYIYEDIIKIILSFTFAKCDYCLKSIHYTDLIKDCIIYEEKQYFVIYDIICIYCLHQLSCKFKIIHI